MKDQKDNDMLLSSKTLSDGFPKINGKGRNSQILSPVVHKTATDLNKTFFNEDQGNRITFNAPNITAFKKAEFGKTGSLFLAQNENVNAKIEANAVENRVRAMQKEEEKMMKKIIKAKAQAEKMMEIREQNNQNYQRKLEWRLKLQNDEDQQREKNQMKKVQRETNRDFKKESLFNQNRNIYSNIRSQRKSCYDEKLRIQHTFVNKNMDAFQRQKGNEFRLNHFYQQTKLDRMQSNKNRYEEQAEQNQQERDYHMSRLQEAQAREGLMMDRLQQTLNQQNAITKELDQAIMSGRVKKSERVEPPAQLREITGIANMRSRSIPHD